MSAGGRKATREVPTTSLHPEGVVPNKSNNVLQVPFALDRLQQSRKSCITTAAHGGQHEIPDWQRLLTYEYISKLTPLPVFQKYKIPTDTLLNFADCLAKVLNNECIPEVGKGGNSLGVTSTTQLKCVCNTLLHMILMCWPDVLAYLQALRAWPREKRDARWLFLNPYTTVIKVNPAKPLGGFVHGILTNRSGHHVAWYSCYKVRVHEAPQRYMGLSAHKPAKTPHQRQNTCFIYFVVYA